MMQVLNRQFQKQILETLANSYPEPCGLDAIFNLALNPELFISQETLFDAYKINIAYLGELGLVEKCPSKISTDALYRITAKGIDFISDDGGLSAILGVVTVKLHAETIRDLLESKISDASISDDDKNSLKKKLSTLSGEALKELTKELVKKGIEHVPDAISWLQLFLAKA